MEDHVAGSPNSLKRAMDQHAYISFGAQSSFQSAVRSQQLNIVKSSETRERTSHSGKGLSTGASLGMGRSTRRALTPHGYREPVTIPTSAAQRQSQSASGNRVKLVAHVSDTTGKTNFTLGRGGWGGATTTTTTTVDDDDDDEALPIGKISLGPDHTRSADPRPPFNLTLQRNTVHPLDAKKALGGAFDLRTMHVAEQDADFKERLVAALGMRDEGLGKNIYRSGMFRFGNLPAWAHLPEVAKHKGLIARSVRLPPSLADVVAADKTSKENPLHSIAAARRAAARDAACRIERSVSPPRASSPFLGRHVLAQEASQETSTSSFSRLPEMTRRLSTAPSLRGADADEAMKGRGRVTLGDKFADVGVQEIVTDVRISGQVPSELRYAQRLRSKLGVRPEEVVTTSVHPKTAFQSSSFSRQRNNLRPQTSEADSARPDPKQGYVRSGGGFLPPDAGAPARPKSVRLVRKTDPVGQSDLKWYGGVTKVVDGRGKMLFYDY